MAASNKIQKEVKEMFELLNTKNVSTNKYESLLQKIGNYAKENGEGKFFKELLRESILSEINN